MARYFRKQHTPFLVESVSTNLANTLNVNFENEESVDESVVESWMEQLYDAFEDYPHVKSLTEQIVARAVEKWKKMPPYEPEQDETQRKPQSVSLWSQLGSFSQRIFWEDIEKVMDGDSKLAALKKVEHIDDISNDWKEARIALQHGLNDAERRTEYLKLHIKWFDQGDASQEYASMQFDLCENMMRHLQNHFVQNCHMTRSDSIRFDRTQEAIFEVLQYWEHLFIRFMAKYWVDYDAANQMILRILNLMKAFALPRSVSPSSSSPYSLLPTHFLAILDPYSKWFQYWIRKIPVQQALHTIRESNVLPHLWQRCHNNGTIPVAHEDDTEVAIHELSSGDDVTISKLNKAVHIQAVSIVCAIMVESRVCYFPWDQLESPIDYIQPSSSSSSSSSSQQLLMDLHLERYNFEELVKKEAHPDIQQRLDLLVVINEFVFHERAMEGLAVVHAHAIEAILWATPCDDSMFPQILASATEALQNPHKHTEELFLMICRWSDDFPEEASKHAGLMQTMERLQSMFLETGDN